MNKYDKFLQCFVASATDPHESLQQPRPQSANIYATDAYILARVKAELCESAYSAHDMQPNFARVIMDTKCYLLMNIAEVAHSIANAPEEEPQYHHPKCPDCGGEKYVTWYYEDSDGETHEMEYECPVCKGRGVLPKLVPVQDTDRYISINGILYRLGFIKKVLNAIYGLGIGQVSVGFSNGRKLVIQVCSGVECMVMPSYSNDIKPSCNVTLNEKKP